MTGLVLDLQRDALDESIPVGALLRRASVIARKLDLTEVDEWIASELGGYGLATPPDYRYVHGEVKVLNPVRGWQVVILQEDDIAEVLTKRPLGQSIFELEDLIASNPRELTLKYPPEQQAILMKMIGTNFQPALHLRRQSLVRIVQMVRGRVLNLALDWEKRGILGEGLTFSGQEKATASQISYTTINHIGEMNNSQLQQHSSGTQTMTVTDTKALVALADAISNAIGALNLATDLQAELEADVATLRSQATSPKPKAGIVRAALRSVKTIFEGCAGNVAATALLAQVTPLLAALPAW